VFGWFTAKAEDLFATLLGADDERIAPGTDFFERIFDALY
jgi:hypothetical protein